MCETKSLSVRKLVVITLCSAAAQKSGLRVAVPARARGSTAAPNWQLNQWCSFA